MALVATMCGATDWVKVVVMSQGMVDWLSQYVDISGGIPCERTFKNRFNTLKPEILEMSLQELSSLLREKIPQEVISFDGQWPHIAQQNRTHRRARKGVGVSALHGPPTRTRFGKAR